VSLCVFVRRFLDIRFVFYIILLFSLVTELKEAL
jgi:hypothetical protein